METKANYLMIGGFVLGVLALAFIFIFWMSNFTGGGKQYVVIFESSASTASGWARFSPSRSMRKTRARSRS